MPRTHRVVVCVASRTAACAEGYFPNPLGDAAARGFQCVACAAPGVNDTYVIGHGPCGLNEATIVTSLVVAAAALALLALALLLWRGYHRHMFVARDSNPGPSRSL